MSSEICDCTGRYMRGGGHIIKAEIITYLRSMLMQWTVRALLAASLGKVAWKRPPLPIFVADVALVYAVQVILGCYIARDASRTLAMACYLAVTLGCHHRHSLLARCGSATGDHPSPYQLCFLIGRSRDDRRWLGRCVAYLAVLSLASLPVPLDWNVPWQFFPIPHALSAALLDVAETVFDLSPVYARIMSGKNPQ